ncbi:hypothetical protein V5E97_14690 [Singulisphaera sp. Ch08]|uniref:Phytase-like domain-containing protein n=1 Tax=Singulisphaera sp. Ch08 TaxID=3120278 RepID=A0AAU7CNU8_9BACT
MLKTRIVSTALAAVVMAAGSAGAAGLSKGTPDWKSAGPLSFGPKGVLFLADSQGAAVFAVDTADVQADSAGGPLKVDGIDEKVAALLGTTSKGIVITDLAVNPASGKAYLTVARGKGPDASAVLVRVDRSGKPEIVSLENVPFAKASLPNPPTKERAKNEAITDLAFVDGRVFVAGLSNEEFASRLLSIPYPFADESKEPVSRSTMVPTAGLKPVRRSGRSPLTRSRGSRSCSPPTPAPRWSSFPWLNSSRART